MCIEVGLISNPMKIFPKKVTHYILYTIDIQMPKTTLYYLTQQ